MSQSSSPLTQRSPSPTPISQMSGLDTLVAVIDALGDSAFDKKRKRDTIEMPSYYHVREKRLVEVTCHHAMLAQKSYGGEKRFLCPPPAIAITPSHGSQIDLKMSVVGADQVLMSQGGKYDDGKQFLFKNLHVPNQEGSKGRKFFQLCLSLNQSVCILSKPIQQISKPSKKQYELPSKQTGHAIHSGDQISLFNRINSQTVRTKYLSLDQQSNQIRLSAPHDHWEPFTILALDESGNVQPNGTPIQYGQWIQFQHSESQLKTQRFKLFRIEKNALIGSGYVCQMHRMAVQSESGLFLSTVNQGPWPAADSSGLRYEEINSSSIGDCLGWVMVGIQTFKTTCFV